MTKYFDMKAEVLTQAVMLHHATVWFIRINEYEGKRHLGSAFAPLAHCVWSRDCIGAGVYFHAGKVSREMP